MAKLTTKIRDWVFMSSPTLIIIFAALMNLVLGYQIEWWRFFGALAAFNILMNALITYLWYEREKVL